MPKGLKELHCRGEVLCHLEVLCLIKPCHCVQIYEGTSGMPLQKLLPKFKGLIWKNNDLDLILKIKYPPYCPAILIEVDTLKTADKLHAKCLQHKRLIGFRYNLPSEVDDDKKEMDYP
jgi:hypothetical protein